MKKKFIKCDGYKIETLYTNKKKIIFYHTPKSAGTTVANILSVLLKNSIRIPGPLTSLSGFKKDKKNLKTTSIFFSENKKEIKSLKPNFIFGHIPYEIGSQLKGRTSFAILRDPYERAISHFNFKIERDPQYAKKGIKFFFENNLIPDNIIVRQFCGNCLKDKIDIEDVEIALDNLLTKIDYLFNIKQAKDAINLMISMLDLPSVIFQNLQVTKKNYYKHSQENMSAIKYYNKFDILLYKTLTDKNLFYKNLKKKINRTQNEYLYYSVDRPINGKKICIINKEIALKIFKL